MIFSQSRLLRATTLLLLTVLMCGNALAANRTPRRRGKVIIIRGAFTVFSLGMNELGDKLAKRGLDVEVIADISAGRAAAKLKSAYQHNHNVGPIIFIGHSRGAELGPKQARYLQKYKIPVKLVVMVDAVHKTSIPANVERCVNLYQKGSFGLPHGVPARADSKRTKIVNADIDQLRSRSKGGSINHFNIDSSAWIHDLVIAEVLRACPAPGENLAQRSSKKTKSSTKRPTSTRSRTQQPTVARRKLKSGLQYPTSIASGLWAGSTRHGGTISDRPKRSNNRSTSPWGNRRTYRSGASTNGNSQMSRPKTIQPKTIQPKTGQPKTGQPKTGQRPSPTKSLRAGSHAAKRPQKTTRPRTVTRSQRTPKAPTAARPKTATRSRTAKKTKTSPKSKSATRSAPRTAARPKTRAKTRATQPGKQPAKPTRPSKPRASGLQQPRPVLRTATRPQSRTQPTRAPTQKTGSRSANRSKEPNGSAATKPSVPRSNTHPSEEKTSAPVQFKLHG